jgi:arginyl-tRNA synthetase
MHVYQRIRENVLQAVEGIAKDQSLSFDNVSAITVEPPRDSSHGDMATNAALVLAKPAKMNPRALAEMLKQALEVNPLLQSVEIAGPGFINFRLNTNVWTEELLQLIKAGVNYGDSAIGSGQKVNVEYVSANPTGPMHIGHARGAVYGDALANLLQKAGYEVTKEYYINDAGAQIDVLARSSFLRYKEALGEDIGEIPEGLYPGDYLVPVGKHLAEVHGNSLLEKSEEEWLPLVRDFAITDMMELIRRDLADLGVVHDVFTSEKKLQNDGLIEKSLGLLDEQNLIYQGVLEPPKGKLPDDWEPREQTLFKATDFGDDVDRALKKSDGQWTYFASDVAYHYQKIQRQFNQLVVVLGADHGGYIKRLSAIVKALSGESVLLDVKISQLVNFLENGVQLKMSKRAGTFTTVKDVIDSVGKDVVRFIMLTRKNDAVLDFDIKQVQEESKDNPVFYVQYANARSHSILRHAKESMSEVLDVEATETLLSKLSSADELELIRLLCTWPRIVEAAAIANEPHRIAFFLQDMAAAFHSFWNKGKEKADLRFIIAEDAELTAARMKLIKAFTFVIKSGFDILGVEPIEEM